MSPPDGETFTVRAPAPVAAFAKVSPRSEEHTSELQSLRHLVCRLLLEKKKIGRVITSTQQTIETKTQNRVDITTKTLARELVMSLDRSIYLSKHYDTCEFDRSELADAS